MASIKAIERGSNGWNKVTYTDETVYEGYTDESWNRIGLGTLYGKDGSITAQGEWNGDELIERMDNFTFNQRINQANKHRAKW